MDLSFSRHVPVAIAADPAAVRLALGEITTARVELHEHLGGTGRLRLFTATRDLPVSPPVVAELGLTERQIAVLELIAEGLPYHEIGVRIGLSTLTVKTHAGRLFKRLGATDRPTAVAAGFRLGILGGA